VDHRHDELERRLVLSRLSRRTVRRSLVAIVAAAGILAAGCGGSSSPFSGSFHAPAGYVAYHGNGYVVAVPRQFLAKAGSVPDQPAGATVTELTRGGVTANKAQSEILLLENPHLKFTIDQVVDNLEVADRTNPNVSNAQISAATTTVPGARAARIITERYVAPDSPSNPERVTFDRKWLMVLIKPGLLLDVVVANAPALGGNVDADAVIHSFRLNRS
jgi:hypothetical protein